MQIKDIMTHPLITAPVGSTADTVARLMWDFDCGIVPLVRDDGHLAGVITDRDLCMAAYTQAKPLSGIVVSSAMAKNVVACHTTDTVESAESLMREHQLRRVPVLDQENRPVGIVSMNDIARLAAHTRRSAVDHEVVQTLAMIGHRRPGITPGADNIVAA